MFGRAAARDTAKLGTVMAVMSPLWHNAVNQIPRARLTVISSSPLGSCHYVDTLVITACRAAQASTSPLASCQDATGCYVPYQRHAITTAAHTRAIVSYS
eukprot:m.54214 g.54214  ORF g.54214 m.54214 type:complete len:100 (-) comp13608_c0_seq2:1018-1317(-)